MRIWCKDSCELLQGKICLRYSIVCHATSDCIVSTFELLISTISLNMCSVWYRKGTSLMSLLWQESLCKLHCNISFYFHLFTKRNLNVLWMTFMIFICSYMQFHIYSRQRIKQVLLGSCSTGGYGKVKQMTLFFPFIVLVVLIILQLLLYRRFASQLFLFFCILQTNCDCFWAMWKQQRVLISAGKGYVWYWWAIFLHIHITDGQNYNETNQTHFFTVLNRGLT